ncbi:MAG: hypothetical protein LBD13_07125 [Spirochaetaceae bacterium]|nr:hypothetical protein [Spirochaetaceae bacterium]
MTVPSKLTAQVPILSLVTMAMFSMRSIHEKPVPFTVNVLGQGWDGSGNLKPSVCLA